MAHSTRHSVDDRVLARVSDLARIPSKQRAKFTYALRNLIDEAWRSTARKHEPLPRAGTLDRELARLAGGIIVVRRGLELLTERPRGRVEDTVASLLLDAYSREHSYVDRDALLLCLALDGFGSAVAKARECAGELYPRRGHPGGSVKYGAGLWFLQRLFLKALAYGNAGLTFTDIHGVASGPGAVVIDLLAPFLPRGLVPPTDTPECLSLMRGARRRARSQAKNWPKKS